MNGEYMSGWKLLAGLALCGVIAAGHVGAEHADYGSVELTGLSRDTDWDFNPVGLSYAMVCNVNGPDGYLSIRSGPGTQYSVNRKLNRLAILALDTGQRQGNWIKVLDANRSFTVDGARMAEKSLAVVGWAHDNYLCSFIDY